MSREVEVVGSISNAARNWHLAAGAIFSAKFGVKLTPKSSQSEDRQSMAASRSKRDSV